jgi:hypothetical protein
MATTIDLLFERHELTIEDIAERSGLVVDRVETIVCGRWLASPQQRVAIAGAFAVDVSAIDWGHSMNPRNVRYHRFGLKEDFSG